jgi:hypothetical protein
MSSTFNLTKNINYNNKIVYDYDKIRIFKSEIKEKDTSRNVTLNTSFVNARRGEPNISYTDENSIADNRYDSIKIYVYKLIHTNIESLTMADDETNIIGELVIEHTNNSDPNDKHYICFLLKYVASGTAANAVNELDIFLNFNQQASSNTYIELNKVIPQQDKCIIYTSLPTEGPYNNTVYIFTTPIDINTTSHDIITTCLSNTNLFADYKEDYIVLPATNISKRGEEDIYIDCSPTGESQETTNTYNIPINSELSSNLEEADHMKTVVNFATFAVYSLVVAIILPPLYKATAIKSALMYTVTETNVIPVPNGIRLRSIDSIICLILLATIVLLFVSGMETIGFFTLFTTIVGGLLIYVYKQNTDYMMINGNKIIYDKQKEFDMKDIFKSFGGLFYSMIEIVVQDGGKGWTKAFYVLMSILFILLIVFAILGNIPWGIAAIIFFIGGPIGISLFLSVMRVFAKKLDKKD